MVFWGVMCDEGEFGGSGDYEIDDGDSPGNDA